MSDKKVYYSARLHVVCLVEGAQDGSYTCDYPFIVFKASSKEEAFQRALSLGKLHETSYRNLDGMMVRWALNAVECIWELGEDPDGMEIGSLMDVYRPDILIDFATDLAPESKVPYFDNADSLVQESDKED